MMKSGEYEAVGSLARCRSDHHGVLMESGEYAVAGLLARRQKWDRRGILMKSDECEMVGCEMVGSLARC